MISKKTPTAATFFKPQIDRDFGAGASAAAAAAGDRVPGAGACSRETSCCEGSWLFPELCVLDNDNPPPQHSLMSSERQRRQQQQQKPCMGAQINIPDHHTQQQNVCGGGKKAAAAAVDDDADADAVGEHVDHRVKNDFGNGHPDGDAVGVVVAGICDGDKEELGCGNEGEEGTVAGGRKKRTWTAEEDEKLKRAVEEHGSGNWMIIERCSGLGRTSKSCRLRWTNHLRPNLKKGSFTEAEERTVVTLHQKYGNKWSFIASKLPGRTDNEVKNFWHGRLRRCRKQYLDIYPPSIQGEHEKFPLTDINNNTTTNTLRVNNFHDRDQQIHRSAPLSTDYNTNFPSSCYAAIQNTSTISTDPNQNHLLLPPPPPPHHHHHGRLSSSSSSSSYTTHHHHQTQMQHPLPINTAQSQLHSNIILHPAALSTDLSPPPPPPFSKFSSPEQDRISPGPPSPVSSHRLQVSSHFNSTNKGSPNESVGQQHYLSATQTTNAISQIPPSLSCQVSIPSPHSPPLELKVTNPLPPYHSYFQVNPSIASSSPLSISPKLEIPVTSPALESLTEMWLNSTLELAKPYSTDFELPQSQSSPSYFNTGSLNSNFTPNPELPSFQSPENGSLQVQAQEATINLHKMGTPENGGLQYPHVQEVHPETDLLYPTPLSKKDNPGKYMEDKIPPIEIFKNGKNADTVSVSLNPNKRKESFNCEGWETINSSSSGSQVKKDLQKNRMVVDKRLKTELLRGKISRREGLLAEISKTGVLLVEKAKKERLISKLLNQSSKQDIILSQSPNTENTQLGEISKIKDFLGDSFSIEDILTDICNLRDEKSHEEPFFAVHSTLLEHQNLQENLFDKSSSDSVLLTSYEQDEMNDLDMLGTQTYGTDLLKPVGGICNELNSAQIPLDQAFHEISRGDALSGIGLQAQDHELDPSMNQLESGNVGSGLSYVRFFEADCLNKSLRRECSESSKKESSEQVQVGCPQWGGQDDQHLILDDSIWGDGDGDGRYIFGNMLPNSVRLDTLESSFGIPSSGGLAMEDDQRNEISMNRKGSEETSRKRYMEESCIERVHGLQELTINDYTQTTTYQMLSSDAQCSSRGITLEEDDGNRNIQPEEMSSLLEFLPTILPEWNNFSHNNTSTTSK